LNGWVKLLAALVLVALPAHASEVAATLDLVPATAEANRFTVRISAKDPGSGLSAADTKTSNATGNFLTRMEVDPATGKVSQLSFEGGNLALSDMTFTLRALIINVATLNTRNLKGYPGTSSPPASVDPETGDFEANQHTFTITEGSITGTIITSPDPVSFTIGDSPLSGSGAGTGTIVLMPVSEDALSYTYRATVELPVDFEETLEEEGVAIKVTGRLKAQNDVVLPKDPFTIWASVGGLDGVGFDSEIHPGEPAGLLWAMGLQPSDSLRTHMPQIRIGAEAERTAHLEFPASGTAAPLTIETSDSLAADSWVPASPGSISVGQNPLPIGIQGEVTVTLDGARKFVRLRATAP
jgi:hypothetical protein